MPKRYSGTVSALITYLERCPCFAGHDGYRVTLSHPAWSKRHVVYVGCPAVLSRAVDASESYDESFRAAISFADADMVTERCYDPFAVEWLASCTLDADHRVVVSRSLHACGAASMDALDRKEGKAPFKLRAVQKLNWLWPDRFPRAGCGKRLALEILKEADMPAASLPKPGYEICTGEVWISTDHSGCVPALNRFTYVCRKVEK